ncbi:KdsC family phosphatase [Priestia aryabhattai]|uniref:KdsC family phosphatase n=1 Tax=Priestia aryabhattai TaxID=412384 RepID=UPI000532CD3A|nr:HAD-IIIA family hydrolase [Priestia aryabhattai]
MIKMLILDVDGTMTDGKIYINEYQECFKAFNVKDGMGISQAANVGVIIAIITGRTSKIVEVRAKELGISEVFQGVKNKKIIIQNLMDKYFIPSQNIAYIGDDINDLPAMKYVGFAACPNDAAFEVKEYCDFVSKMNGGEGAVRDIIENILRKDGRWNTIIKEFKYINQ